MKILVINTVPFRLNGISTVIQNYYSAMDKKDLHADFIAMDEPSEEYKYFFEKNKVECYILKRRNVAGYFRKLVIIAKREGYDLVHVHGNSATMVIELLACWIGGIRIRIAHVHNTATAHPILNGLLYPFFDKVCTFRVACGDAAGKWLFRYRPFLELKNGIDLKRYLFDPDIRKTYRQKLNAGNRVIIGHVGNFNEQKNHLFLLECYTELLKKNSNYLLLLIGSGKLFDCMKQMAVQKEISSQVFFLGKTIEVEKYLQAMDLFVLPSVHEGFPVVLVEAQAAGLPCFVADTIDHKVNITGGVHFLPITNKTDWAERIQNAELPNCRDRYDRCRLWQAKLADAGYDINENAQQMRTLYERLIHHYTNS